MELKKKLLFGLWIILLLTSASFIKEDDIKVKTTNVLIFNLDLEDQAIQNITLAQNAIFNATIKLEYLESINGDISDLIEKLNLAINLFNNATEMLNRSNYNQSIYLTSLSISNATEIISEVESRIPETIEMNQHKFFVCIIIIIVAIIVVIVSVYLTYFLINKYRERKLLNMKVVIPEDEPKND
jgi:hypothetical protein